MFDFFSFSLENFFQNAKNSFFVWHYYVFLDQGLIVYKFRFQK